METFYYDFYKIESFLRDFEREHKLTQLGFDETNFGNENTMTNQGNQTKEYARESRTKESRTKEPTTQEPSNIGDILANQVNFDTIDDLPSQNSQKFKDKDEVDLAALLHQEARHLSTGEAVLDGVDLLNMGMEVTAIAAKLLEQAKNDQHQKTLEKIVDLSDQLDQLESQDKKQESKSNPLYSQKNELKSTQEIDSFIEDAIKYLAQRTSRLEESLKIKTNEKENERDFDDHTQQLDGIQKRLNVIDNLLSKQSSEISSVSASEVYGKFLKYFNSVDDFSRNDKKEKYQVSSKTFGEINLDSLSDNQTISLTKDNVRIYHAELQDNQWQEIKNTLSEQQIKKIKQLPQSKEQVAKDYSGKYLANFLHQKLQESGQIEKTVEWKFDDENERTKFYDFKITQTSNEKQISILGKDKNNTNIFTAKINSDGLINIINHKIPVGRINKLIEQQSHEDKHQKLAESNSENLARKSSLKLKRSR